MFSNIGVEPSKIFCVRRQKFRINDYQVVILAGVDVKIGTTSSPFVQSCFRLVTLEFINKILTSDSKIWEKIVSKVTQMFGEVVDEH